MDYGADLSSDYGLSLSEETNSELKYFEELYVKYKKQVFLLALSILRDYGLAEDAMQETFLKIKQKTAEIKYLNNPNAWILTVTHNISVNILRKRSRELIDSDILEFIEAPEDTLQTTIDFNKALKQLNEVERCIVMFRLLGMKYKEISNFYHITASDARMRYSRAINKLKEYFGEEEI